MITVNKSAVFAEYWSTGSLSIQLTSPDLHTGQDKNGSSVSLLSTALTITTTEKKLNSVPEEHIPARCY